MLQNVTSVSGGVEEAVTAFIDACKSQYRDLWKNYVESCRVFEIDNVTYIAHVSAESATYTVDGNTITLTFYPWGPGTEPETETLTMKDANTLQYTAYDGSCNKVSYAYVSDVLSYVE